MAEGIKYSGSLVQALERSLRSAFNQPAVILTRRPNKAGAVFPISLENGGKSAQTDEGSVRKLAGILTQDGEPTTFYFGFAAAFEILAREHILQDASLVVFHDIYAGQLAPLFRAEWDHKGAWDAASKHAQPHWHFVQRPEQIEGIVRALISPPPDFTAEPESELFASLVDYRKFHFAMTSFPEQKQVFQSDDFQKWFESLTKYIAQQIAYIVLKAPPGALQARDFVPG